MNILIVVETVLRKLSPWHDALRVYKTISNKGLSNTELIAGYRRVEVRVERVADGETVECFTTVKQIDTEDNNGDGRGGSGE